MNDIEIMITRRLEFLTVNGTIIWKKFGQIYIADYKNMTFKIEDSGQNWLEICQLNGAHLTLIMDTLGHKCVEQLLEQIKYAEAAIHRPKRIDTRTSVLGTILEVLNQET